MKKIILILNLMLSVFFANAQVTNITSTTNPSCFGSCDGVINLQTVGGFPPFTYQIYPLGNPPQASTTFNNLCAGVYTIVVTDANSNTGTYTTVLNQPTLININSISQTDPTCGQCNGVATVNAFGGIPPYNYNVTPNTVINNGMITNACPNTIYTVTVVDGNGCSVTTAITFGNTTPFLSLSGDTIECGIQKPIVAEMQNGIPPITFTLQPGNINNSTGIFNIVASTSYTISATDANSCTVTSSFTSNPFILSNALTGVTTTSISYDESCNLANDGGIDINPIPASGLTYLWNNNAISQDILNSPSGNYSVKISNSNGDCQILFDTINVIGNNCGTISGNVYHDSTSNCVFDINDFYIPNILIQLSTGDMTYTNANGYYEFNQVPFGTHTITPSNLITANSCLQGNSVTVNAANPIINNNDFKDSLNNSLDESISIYSSQFIAAFGVGNYFVNLYNNKTYPISSSITLLLDSILNFQSASIIPTSVVNNTNGDSITWNLNLNPGFTSFYVYCSYPFTVPINTQLNTCASVYPTVFIDNNLSNNSACWNHQIFNSYDPNDKSVSPLGEGIDGNITLQDEKLDYFIRFQNTGTAPAINVEIIDTLSDKLDINSFNVNSFSQDYVIDIENGNIVHFKFKNIMLPDSNSNEPASHGYIGYSIKQKNTNQLGDVINNSASIYFDYNDPIKTNTTVNTIWQPLSVFDYKTSALKIAPNPMNKNCIISLPQQLNDAHIEIFNSIGQSIFEDTFDGNSYEFKNQAYPKGNYFIKINTENGKQFTGKLLIE